MEQLDHIQHKSLSVNITYDKRYKDGTPLTVISYVMVVWITTVNAVSLLNNIDTSKIIPICSEHKVGLSCLSAVLTSVTQTKTGLTVKLIQTISTINK